MRALGLRGNKLGGSVPGALAGLGALDTLELDYNLLTATDPAVLALLAGLDPEWSRTQTVPPTGLSAATQSETAIALSWVPISYTQNTGYYEVSYATTPGGPYAVHGTTANKAAAGYLASDLDPATIYYFVVRTWSAAVGYQQSDLWSPYTAEVVAGTTGAPTATQMRTEMERMAAAARVRGERAPLIAALKGLAELCDRLEAWAAARAAVERANAVHGARIAVLEPGPSDPFLLYLYPGSDTYFTGDPPSPGKPALNPRRSGGHHLSPLTPDPWINALTGLWSPRPGARAVDGAPVRSTEVKEFLLGRLAR